MTEGTVVPVKVKHWYQSRELVTALLTFLGFLIAGVDSAIKAGNSVSVLLLISCAVAALQAVWRASAENIITGLAIFDGPKPTDPAQLPDPNALPLEKKP